MSVKRVSSKISCLGICDSGIGGLPLLSAVRSLGFEKYVYIGDTAHVPYGDRSSEEIIKLSSALVDFLVSKGADAILVACNTMCTVALPKLIKKYPNVTFIEIVHPTISHALRVTQHNRVGVMGTRATVDSGLFLQAIDNLSPDTFVYQQACPELVPLIEQYPRDHALIMRLLKPYLSSFMVRQVDTLILGCTHYIHIQDLIQDMLGPTVCVVHAAQSVTSQVSTLCGMVCSRCVDPEVAIYATGKQRILVDSLGLPSDHVQTTNLQSLV